MLHWLKKSLLMPYCHINFDQNGPPYLRVHSLLSHEFQSIILLFSLYHRLSVKVWFCMSMNPAFFYFLFINYHNFEVVVKESEAVQPRPGRFSRGCEAENTNHCKN